MMSLGISSGCEVLDVGCAKDAIVLADWGILENGINEECVESERVYRPAILL